MSTASSMIVGHKSSGLYVNPRSRALSCNPMTKLVVSKCKDDISFWSKSTRLQSHNHKTKRYVYIDYWGKLQLLPRKINICDQKTCKMDIIIILYISVSFAGTLLLCTLIVYQEHHCLLVHHLPSPCKLQQLLLFFSFLFKFFIFIFRGDGKFDQTIKI